VVTTGSTIIMAMGTLAATIEIVKGNAKDSIPRMRTATWPTNLNREVTMVAATWSR